MRNAQTQPAKPAALHFIPLLDEDFDEFDTGKSFDAVAEEEEELEF